MANKPKRGLGRGLGALLDGPSEETSQYPAPVASAARETVNFKEEASAPAVKQPAPVAKEEPKPAPVKKPSVQEPEEETVYTDKAENTTIKSVRAREVAPKQAVTASAASAPTPVVPKEVDEVDIDAVSPNPDQPRTSFKREELEELAESIKRDGLLQPILVREMGEGQYQIIAGERRWQACKSLNMAKVPIRIKKADDNRAIELALVENIQRSNLNPIEEAYGYRRMMERGKMTQSEVAKTVSKGRSTIANALRLLELPEDAQQLLFEEKITAGHARAILSIPTEEGRKKLTDKLVQERLSVRDTENLARLFSGKTNEAPAKRTPAPQSFKKVARALRKQLDASVRVKTVKGKNKIEIEFADEEELQRLFEMITTNAKAKKAAATAQAGTTAEAATE